MTKFWISLAFLAIAVPSHAVVYSGNPDFSIYVDRPAGDLNSGSVYLTKIRIHKCDGAYTDYSVGQTIDPVDGFTYVDVAGGNLCGATLYWGNDMLLYGNNGSPFTLQYDPNTTAITFGTPIPPVALAPYTVVSGSPTGTGPKIYSTMN